MKKISKETNHTPSISWRGINLGTKPVIGYYSLTVIQLIIMYFTEHHFMIFITINLGYIIVAYFVLNYLDKKRKDVGTAVKFIDGKCVVEEGSKEDIFLRQCPLTTEDMYDGSKVKWQILDEIGKWNGNLSKYVGYLTEEDIPKSEGGNEIVQTHTFKKPKTIIIKTNGLDEK